MAVDQDHLAENVRRLAGMHDISLGKVAERARISKAGLAKIVDRDPSRRSYPKTETAMRLAEVFGVSLNDLYEDWPVAVDAAVRAHTRRLLEAAAEGGQ
jgi:transcriptional regulator with XRE-family HTH domain